MIVICITLRFKKGRAKSVNIIIEDKNLSSDRPVSENIIKFSPNSIWIDMEEKGKLQTYAISFSKTIFDKKDLSKHCTNYPNELFDSYQKCENSFIQDAYNDIHGDLNPIWAADSSRKVSESTLISSITEKALFGIINLITGSIPSKCPLPCTTVSATSRFISTATKGTSSSKESLSSNFTSLDLIPAESVLVTKTEFVKYPLFSLLAGYGGSMGLWLGLGVVQLCKICFVFIKRCTLFQQATDI